MNTLVPESRVVGRTCAVEVLLISVALLRLLEIPWYGLLVCLLLLCGLTMFGRVINSRLFDENLSLGTSFVVGCSAYVFLGQLLLIVGVGYQIAHWLAFGVVVGGAALIWSVIPPKIAETHETVSAYAQTAVAIGLAALSIHHVWLAPFSAAVIVRTLVSHRQNSTTSRLMTNLCLMLGWVVALELRPEKWWYFYQGNDAQFFESISWSIARWSIYEHPGFVGGSISNYHWFTYALFGSLSQLAALEPWVAFMKVGPLLLAILLASLLMPSRGLFASVTPVVWVVMTLAVVAMGVIRADSLPYSFVVAFAVLNVVSRSRDSHLGIPHRLLFILLSVTIILTKVSTAAVLLAILALEPVVQILRRRKASFLVLSCFVAGFAAAYVLFLRTNDSGMLNQGFGIRLSTSINELQDLLEPGVTLNYVLWVAVLLCFRQTKRQSSLSSIVVSVYLIASLAVGYHLLLTGKTTSYFAAVGIALVSFTSLWRIEQSTIELHTNELARLRLLHFPVFCFGVLLGYLSSRIFRRANLALDPSGTVSSFVVDTLMSGGFLLAVLLLGLTLLAIRRPLIRATTWILIAFAVFVGQSTEQFVRTAQLGPGVYTSSSISYSVFGTTDLIRTATFIRSNTSSAEILASNQFCDVGETRLFPRRTEEEFRLQRVVLPDSECKWGGANFLLPAYTQRRFLVQGLRFQLGTREISPDQLSRLVLSLSFANRPSPSNFRDLKARGVSGFIVNLSLTKERDWSDFAVERFRSGDYLYLELK